MKNLLFSLLCLSVPFTSFAGESKTKTSQVNTEVTSSDAYSSKKFGATTGLDIGLVLASMVEAHYRPSSKWTVSLGAGGFESGWVGNKGDYNTFMVRGSARWHPVGRSFYLGSHLGYYSLDERYTHLKTTFITPHLGWMWILKPGITLGFEVGAATPITRNASEGKDHYNYTVFPYITPIKLGFMF